MAQRHSRTRGAQTKCAQNNNKFFNKKKKKNPGHCTQSPSAQARAVPCDSSEHRVCVHAAGGGAAMEPPKKKALASFFAKSKKKAGKE